MRFLSSPILFLLFGVLLGYFICDKSRTDCFYYVDMIGRACDNAERSRQELRERFHRMREKINSKLGAGTFNGLLIEPPVRIESDL